MPLPSRLRQTTRLVVMCTMSQCRLRYPYRNLRVTNVNFIVTYYTLPPIESSDSFWMTRSQRSKRRDKGLLILLRERVGECLVICSCCPLSDSFKTKDSSYKPRSLSQHWITGKDLFTKHFVTGVSFGK